MDALDSLLTGAFLIAVSVVLAILELAGAIKIGWLWVFSPIWMPLAVFMTMLVILIVVSTIVDGMEGY